MGSWWTWGCHGIDTSAYDEAVENIEKYTKLLEKMEKIMDQYNSDKAVVDSYFNNADSTLLANNGETKGHLKDFYVSKVDQWKSHRSVMYDKLNDEFSVVLSKKEVVRYYITQWEQKRDEEARKMDAIREQQIAEENRKREEMLKAAAEILIKGGIM